MLDMIINHFNDGNKAKFASRLGIKPQALSMWFTRNSFDAELIYSKCEGISGDWLLSGKGEMLREFHITNDNEELIKLRAENEVLRELVGLKKKALERVG